MWYSGLTQKNNNMKAFRNNDSLFVLLNSFLPRFCSLDRNLDLMSPFMERYKGGRQ